MPRQESKSYSIKSYLFFSLEASYYYFVVVIIIVIFSLFVCAGYTGYDGCKKLDLNAENPSWSSFVDLPWQPYHFMLETVGDYMYAIGQTDTSIRILYENRFCFYDIPFFLPILPKMINEAN